MLFYAWSFLILIVMQSYTGALSAYLTTEGLKPTIKSAEELAGQFEIEYGMYGKGSTHDFFRVCMSKLHQSNSQSNMYCLNKIYLKQLITQDSQEPYIKKLYSRMEQVTKSRQ